MFQHKLWHSGLTLPRPYPRKRDSIALRTAASEPPPQRSSRIWRHQSSSDVDGFDLDAARLIRLQQDLDRLLPDEEEGPRRELLQWLLVGARQGVDLIPSFRDALRWQRKNPPAATATGVGTPPARGDSGLEMEPLPTPRRATLWPCRPKRLPDELLSSWLWRTARESGAPPRRFVFDAIGSARFADVDREIDDAAIARLAFLSGQSETHLRRGTMRPDVPIAAFDLLRDPRDGLPWPLRPAASRPAAAGASAAATVRPPAPPSRPSGRVGSSPPAARP